MDFELPSTTTPKEEPVNDPFPFEEVETPVEDIEEPVTPVVEIGKETEVETPFTIGDDHTEDDEAYQGPALEPYNPRLDLENYKFPHLNLLDHYDDTDNGFDME